MLYSAFNVDRSLLADLCEVTDQNQQPICLLHIPEILSQNLLHKTVALLLYDRLDRFLLSRQPDTGFNFSFYTPLPAGWGGLEYCAELLSIHFKSDGVDLRLFSNITPCAENDNSFTAIYTASAELTMHTGEGEFMVIDYLELKALIDRQYAVFPLLAKIIDLPQMEIFKRRFATNPALPHG